MSFIKGLKQSVTQIVNTLKSKETVVKHIQEETMNPSAVRLAKAYEPMVKFVGGRHPVLKHGKALAHPCTVDGLMPGSLGVTPVSEFLKNYKPFQVFSYKNPKSTSATSKYQYTDRPLKENEVASTAELPPRFQYRPLDEAELEAINSGGAY